MVSLNANCFVLLHRVYCICISFWKLKSFRFLSFFLIGSTEFILHHVENLECGSFGNISCIPVFMHSFSLQFHNEPVVIVLMWLFLWHTLHRLTSISIHNYVFVHKVRFDSDEKVGLINLLTLWLSQVILTVPGLCCKQSNPINVLFLKNFSGWYWSVLTLKISL